jgi:hypothetical protein
VSNPEMGRTIPSEAITTIILFSPAGLEPVGLEESKRSGSSRQAAKRLLAKFGWARADFSGFADWRSFGIAPD